MGSKRNKIVSQLVQIIRNDTKLFVEATTGSKNRAFGLLLHKWLDDSKESVIDRYVDEEAKEVTSYALNIIRKEVK